MKKLCPLLLAPLLAACAGSAPSSIPSWDISQGEYLSEKEYQDLSSDEAIDYCRQLAAEVDIQKDNAQASAEAIPGVDGEIADMTDRLADMQDANRIAEATVAELERELKQLQELPPSYTVVAGDWLRKISGQPRIYSDEERWRRIFRANRKKIADPNLIYPGQVLDIPRGQPTTYTVQEGETLRIIAGRWEIYGNRNDAARIFQANRDQISDPDLIRPGMGLKIPR